MKDFHPFREKIIGIDQLHPFPGGKMPIVYADWTASGRLYRPIEEYLMEKVGPFVANPHTDTTVTGTLMTAAYHQAQTIFKKHVKADENDVIFFAGFGMTAVINKLQRLLGLRIPEKFYRKSECREKDKSLVILTHMEHHSNQTTWNVCCCQVEIVQPNREGLPDLNHLEDILKRNRHRELKIGSFTACSNVTGIQTPVHQMAEIMHRYGGWCFVDYAASAPYVDINMHPENPAQKLDAIFLSPHKFLGGPGSSGVMIMDQALYTNEIPDQPGGGTVLWTNPWGEQRYYSNIEVREDGGTPGYLQAIKGALALRLKEEMGTGAMLEKEEVLKDALIEGLATIAGIKILEPHVKKRLGIVSFYSLKRHHNLIVQLLNDRFGIQARGGCSCAGTYGHILLRMDKERSRGITDKIDRGDLSEKPGWVRISIHPTTTPEEIAAIVLAVREVFSHYDRWSVDYEFNPQTGEFRHKSIPNPRLDLMGDLHL